MASLRAANEAMAAFAGSAPAIQEARGVFGKVGCLGVIAVPNIDPQLAKSVAKANVREFAGGLEFPVVFEIATGRVHRNVAPHMGEAFDSYLRRLFGEGRASQAIAF